ncbi:MAG: hypothetical protein J6W19_05040 [Prevotella sp.]|nr:hypothetical protein [Prevotella sp.]
MKQIFLIVAALVAIATGAKADVEINSTNFPDANFRSYLLSQSYGKDGKLTDSEIAGITKLSVPSKGIQSLRGIKYFTALKELEAYRNSINENEMEHLVRELPVQSGATLCPYYFGASDEGSYMNVLQILAAQAKGWNVMMVQYMGTGEYLMPMTQYPPSIPIIYITPENFPDENFRNALKELGIGNFYGSQPYLTTEDVSVKELNVSGNKITSLKGIECFTALEYLQCGANELTDLDVSKNTALKRLGCNGNRLTALDVSKNTALERLSCDNNQLTALDVSKNTKLYELYCWGNQIKGTDMDNLIASLPEKETNTIQAFSFNVVTNSDDEGNVCSKQQVEAAKARGWTPYYFDTKEYFKYLYYGIILNAKIDSKNFPDANFRNYVSSTIDTDRNSFLSTKERNIIKKMDVSNMNIESLKGIECFDDLEQLSCSFNRLKTVDLSNNTKLKSLNIYGNQLTELDLSQNTLLENLYCYENQLTTLDLSQNKKLQAVNIAKNLIRDQGMDNLIDNLPNIAPVTDEYGYVETASLYAMNSETSTGNFISKAQVRRARAKGWTVYRVVEYEGNSSWEEYEVTKPKKGDVNDDNSIDVADIGTVIDVMAGKAFEYKDYADVNGDKNVDVADIATIIDIMAGKIIVDETCPNESHPHWIDLGLPSGTQWRCCNKGATKPEDYGSYYTFDEAQVFNPPTLDQIVEMLDNCTSEWTTLNGVNGLKFTGHNGRFVFLPAAGGYWDGKLLNAGSGGSYWSSTPYDEDNGYGLYFYSSSEYWYIGSNRHGGQSVRLVR